MIICTDGSGNAYWSLDGSSLTEATAGQQFQGGSSIAIGYDANVDTYYSQIDVGEVIVWGDDETPNVSAIYNYLSNKWS